MDRLTQLQSLETEIRVAVVGIGSIGNGLVFQSTITPGIRTVAVADTRIQLAIHCAEWLNLAYDVVHDLGALHDTIRRGRLAVCESGILLAQSECVDVYLEATNSIPAGGEHALTALEHGQHVVMMNYEADLMFGPLLLSEARKRGLVYTGCDGDQPSVVKRLIDDLCFWGFDLVMAGSIKGYLDRYANPTSIIPEADKRDLDYQMCTSYTDGTKLCVEMAVVANALGLRTAVPGMHGPRCGHVGDVFEHFDLGSLWNNGGAVVDYVLGAQPTGGVFAIGYTEHEFQQFTMDWFPPKMGPGPFSSFLPALSPGPHRGHGLYRRRGSRRPGCHPAERRLSDECLRLRQERPAARDTAGRGGWSCLLRTDRKLCGPGPAARLAHLSGQRRRVEPGCAEGCQNHSIGRDQ